MARTVWSKQTLSGDTDLAKYEANVASWGVGSLTNKHTLAKEEIARLLRLRLATYKPQVDPKETQADGVTTASDKTFTSALAHFSDYGTSVGDRFWVKSGADKGVHVIETVTSNTSLELSVALTASASSIGYEIEPEVLDLIKNPLVLTPAACWLTLHYCALELGVNSEFWEAKATTFWEKFQASYSQLVPDLLLDLDEDNQISTGERKMGITSGELLR